MTLGKLSVAERADRTSHVAVRLILLGLLAFLLVHPMGITAQQQTTPTGRIIGTVVDSMSRAPLGGVQVYLEGSSLGTMTRQNGTYAIANVPAGRYQLRAERIGMTLALREVVVATGATVQANFALEVKALGLDEIVVTGTAGAARRREVGNSIQQINVANLPDRPVDVTKMLQAAAPGIEVTNGGAGAGQGAKIRLRGSKSI